MTLLDNVTYEVIVTFFKHKSEALQKYKDYMKFIKVQHGVKVIKTFRSDRRGEYTSAEFQCFLAEQGTHHELTVHDSSVQNGAAERFFCMSIMRALAMLIRSGLPTYLWTYAMHHAVWLWNCTGSRITSDTTPYECITGEKPDLMDLREWYCKVWVRMENCRKLELRTDEGHFIGYSTESKGLIIYWPQRRTTTVKRNVIWDTSMLEPANDELPPNWLIDLISGSTEDEKVPLDIDNAVPSQGPTPADLAYDGTLPIDPAPAVEPNDTMHPAPAAPPAQDADASVLTVPLVPPVTPPHMHSMPVAPPDAPRARWNLQPSRYTSEKLASGT
ncbi:hypothetical protein EWM64_g9246 [Hericium alpestre]|uniref:Integrase catalytic domain-containing protein n=1 Tax=Hericium alpestre TaxID=135208 RepID=A0A4Y9ZIZ0_9AGAM|nr:hypothetical protein EWM64_g9246 [Hericium alpestre]